MLFVKGIGLKFISRLNFRSDFCLVWWCLEMFGILIWWLLKWLLKILLFKCKVKWFLRNLLSRCVKFGKIMCLRWLIIKISVVWFVVGMICLWNVVRILICFKLWSICCIIKSLRRRWCFGKISWIGCMCCLMFGLMFNVSGFILKVFLWVMLILSICF